MIRLNLLPSSEKKTLALERIQRWLVFYGSAVIGALSVFIVLLCVTWLFINIQLKSASSTLVSVQTSLNGKDSKEQQGLIILLNQDLKKIGDLQAERKIYSDLLISLTDLIPAGLWLTTLSIDEQGETIINGFARKREQVLALKDLLENSPLFTDVESPLANLVKPADINFYFKFNLRPDALNQ